MDQHPIPQDVTGFQFKLIGTMTVKQFGYVASGVILAVVLFYLPTTGFFWILAKIVLIPLLGGSGVVVAFVPIEGRPVDVMATNFFKAVFSPNQYVYRKQGRKFSFSTVQYTKVDPAAAAATTAEKGPHSTIKDKEISKKEAQLQAFLQSSRNEPKTELDKKELTKLSSLALPAAPKPVLATPPTGAPKPAVTPAAHPAAVHTPPKAVPTIAPAAPTAIKPQPLPLQAAAPSVNDKVRQEQTLVQQETALQQQLQSAKQEETSVHTPAAHQKVVDLEKQMQDIHAQKQRLEEELLKLKSQLNAQTQPTAPVQQAVHAPAPMPAPAAQPTPAAPTMLTASPAPAQPQAPAAAPVAPGGVIPASQYAKTVTQQVLKKADLPKVSDTPNVVCGIVKDPRGNILPNMLVEVKDKDGNPVRAFKTNALGQFASATPLAPGVYTIEIDDPKKQHSFDIIQITANNQIMLPIEIISHDAREALRQQLFN